MGEAWCPQGLPLQTPLSGMAKLDYTWGSRGHTQDSGGYVGSEETERLRRGWAASHNSVLQNSQPLAHSFQWTRG